MDIIQKNKEKINGALETFDRIVNFHLEFRYFKKTELSLFIV